MATSTLYTLVALTLIGGAISAKFPEKWKKCPKTGNEECLKTAINGAISSLKDGNKALGVIPLDPVHFEKMSIQQGGSSPVAINLTFFDIDIIGHSRMNVKSLKVDWDNHEMEMVFEVPGTANLIGDYTIAGKVLVLPIQGEGKSNLTFFDMQITLKLKGREMIKNGKKYMDIQKGEYIIEPKRAYFYFGNLFKGQKGLGDNMNKFLNENWSEITGELRGTISAAVGEAMRQIANTIFHKIPLEQMYTS